MSKLKNKKYYALIGIVVLVIGIIGLFAYGKVDKYKGLVKVKNVVSRTTSLSASVMNSVENETTSKGSDEIKYQIKYTLDEVSGVTNRNVVIEGKLKDEEARYARFKEINRDNITSTISNDGKEIEIHIENVPLGEEQDITLRVVINNAPNGFKIKPSIKIKEETGEETSVLVNEVEVVTNSLEGKVIDKNGLAVSNIELSLNDETGEIKRTYTDEDGNYIFSDIENKAYRVDVEEEIYEKTGEENTTGGLLIKVKDVIPYQLEARKTITKLDLVVNGKEEHYTYNDLERVVQSVKNAKTISGQITYKIIIKNTGEKAGRLSKLVDYVKDGLSFDQNKNIGWSEKKNNLYYDIIEGKTINPGETKEIGLRLDIKNTNEIKTYINEIDLKGETYENVVYILNGEKYREETVFLGEKIKAPVIQDEGFSGWYTDRKLTNKYNFNNDVTKDLILYGVTTTLKHKVEFYDKNPLTNVETKWTEQEIENGKKATKPESPTHEGFEFECWMDEYDNIWNFDNPVERDVKLTSCYSIITYNIIYTGINDDERAALSNPTTYTIKTPTITLVNPDNRSDGIADTEIFMGWTGSNGNNPSKTIKIEQGSTGNKTFNANFEQVQDDEFTITYNLEGGELEQGKTNPNTYTIRTNTFTLNNPHKDHYDFIGWTGTGLNEPTIEVTVPQGSSGNREYTANYRVRTNNVIFNDYDVESNDPASTVNQFGDTVVVVEGNSVNPPATNPEHTGYTCDKWSKRINGNYDTDAYDFNDPVNEDLTLYTLCKKNIYTVTYMNGDQQYAIDRVPYKEKTTKPVEDPVNGQLAFIGWTLNNEYYDFENSVITQDITLYADFKEVKEPVITHTPTEWTNQNVTVTISKNAELADDTGYTYKYRINEGEFHDYTGPFEVEENCTVYAVAKLGNAYSDEVSHIIDNIDKIKPVITLANSSSITKNSFTVSASTYDNESGVDYVSFYLGDTLVSRIIVEKDTEGIDSNPVKNVSYTYENLDPQTVYEVKVITTDVATNNSDAYPLTIETTNQEVYVARIIQSNNADLNEEDYVYLPTLRSGLEYIDNSKGINCVTNQCTIQMLTSVGESNDVLEGQDITLDLNSYTINGVSDYTFNVLGEFTVIDSTNSTGEITNSNHTAILINENGSLTLGINEVGDPVVNANSPLITGKLYGVRKMDGTFNYYDGKVKAKTAISGEVNDTPYLYNANVSSGTDPDSGAYQESSLNILAEAVARIRSKYYATLDGAIEAATGGTATTSSTDTHFRELLLSSASDAYEEDGEIILPTGASFTIDLTGQPAKKLQIRYRKDNENTMKIGVKNQEEYLADKDYTDYGQNANPNREYYYTTIDLPANDIYYLDFSNMKISSIGFFEPATEQEEVSYIVDPSKVINSANTYGFDYDEDTKSLRSNNSFVDNSVAYSYIEVDLTNESENKRAIISMTLDAYSNSSYGMVNISETQNTYPTTNTSSYLGCLNGSNSGVRNLIGPRVYDKVLQAGHKYYIEFYYYVYSSRGITQQVIDNTDSKDQLIINSVDVVSLSNERSIDLNTFESTSSNPFYLSGSTFMSKPSINNPADSYIKLDLRNNEKDVAFVPNINFYNSSLLSRIYITNSPKMMKQDSFTQYNNPYEVANLSENTILTFNYDSYYENGSSTYYNSKDRYFVLKKGRVYFIHFNSFYYGSSSYDGMKIYGLKLYDIDSSILSIGDVKINEGTEDLHFSNISKDEDDDVFRYITNTPNNYIYFNCDDYSNPSAETCELWRVVGAFKTEDENGNVANRLKLIRDQSLGQFSWDSSTNNGSSPVVNGGNGINEWSQADLMKLMNPGYEDNKTKQYVRHDEDTDQNVYEDKLTNNSLYWNRQKGFCTVGSSDYIGGNLETENCDFTTTGIKDSTKPFIDTVKWYTGATSYSSGSMPVYIVYQFERSDKTGKPSSWPADYNDNVERTTSWYGKVGLLSQSDYMYAMGKGTYGASRQQCLVSYSSECISYNNWLSYTSNNEYKWAINPYYNSYAYNVMLYGNYPSYANASSTYHLKPSVYLSTKTLVDSGDGTSENPYTIKMGNVSNPDSDYMLSNIREKYEEEYDEGEVSYTSDYSKVKNMKIYPFEYDSENDLYRNTNARKPGTISSSIIPIDMTGETKAKRIKIVVNSNDDGSSYARGVLSLNTSSTPLTYNAVNYSDYYGFITTFYGVSSDYEYQPTLVPGKINYLHISYMVFRDPSSDKSYETTISYKIIEDNSSMSYDVEELDGYGINRNDKIDTIEMLKDISLDHTVKIPAQKSVILDLNGYTLSSQNTNVLSNYGELKVIDSTIDSSGVGTGKINASNGTGISNNREAVLNLESGALNVSGSSKIGVDNLNELTYGENFTFNIIGTNNKGINNKGTITDGDGKIIVNSSSTNYCYGIYNTDSGVINSSIDSINVLKGVGVYSNNPDLTELSNISVTGNPTYTVGVNVQSNSLTKLDNITVANLETGIEVGTTHNNRVDITNTNVQADITAFIFDDGIYELDDTKNQNNSFYGNITNNYGKLTLNLTDNEIKNEILNNNGQVVLTSLKDGDTDNNITSKYLRKSGVDDVPYTDITFDMSNVTVNNVTNNKSTMSIDSCTINNISNVGVLTLKDSTTNEITNNGYGNDDDRYYMTIENSTSTNVTNNGTGYLTATDFNYNYFYNLGNASIDGGSNTGTGVTDSVYTTDLNSSNKITYGTSNLYVNVTNKGTLTIDNQTLTNIHNLGVITLNNVTANNLYNTAIYSCSSRGCSNYYGVIANVNDSNLVYISSDASVFLNNSTVSNNVRSSSLLYSYSSGRGSATYARLDVDNSTINGDLYLGTSYTNKKWNINTSGLSSNIPEAYLSGQSLNNIKNNSSIGNVVIAKNYTDQISIYMGVNDESVSTEKPSIISITDDINGEIDNTNIPIYNQGDAKNNRYNGLNFNFYDGVIRGTLAPDATPIIGLQTKVNNMPDGYDIKFVDEEGYRKTILGKDEVAQIGNVKYTNIQDAINSIDDSNTEYVEIKLLKDIISADTYYINDKKFKFNFDGHTITSYADIVFKNNSGDVIFYSDNNVGGITNLYNGYSIATYGEDTLTTVNSGNYTYIYNDDVVAMTNLNGVVQKSFDSHYPTTTINDGIIGHITNKGKLIIESLSAKSSLDNIGDYNRLLVNSGTFDYIDCWGKENTTENRVLNNVSTNHIELSGYNYVFNNASVERTLTSYNGTETIPLINVSNNNSSYYNDIEFNNSTIHEVLDFKDWLAPLKYAYIFKVNSGSRFTANLNNTTVLIEGTDEKLTQVRTYGIYSPSTTLYLTMKDVSISASNPIYADSTVIDAENTNLQNNNDCTYFNERYGIRAGRYSTIDYKSGTINGIARDDESLNAFEYGIYIDNNNSTTVNIGIKGDEDEVHGGLLVSETNPSISGITDAIYFGSRDRIKFYDGELIGPHPYSGTLTDIETGYVSKKDENQVTSKFGSYEREYLQKLVVAELESTGERFTKVQDAVDAAATIDKITLLNDIEFYASYSALDIPADKTLTIDFNGKEVYNNDKVLTMLDNKGTLTFENVNMRNGNLNNSGSLTIKSGTLKNGKTTNSNYLEIENVNMYVSSSTSHELVNNWNGTMSLKDGTYGLISNSGVGELLAGTVHEIDLLSFRQFSLGKKGDLKGDGTLNVNTTSPSVDYIYADDTDCSKAFNFYDGQIKTVRWEGNYNNNHFFDKRYGTYLVNDTETGYNIVGESNNNSNVFLRPSKENIVTNVTADVGYTDLQTAFDQASDNDVLELNKSFVVKNKNLTTYTVASGKKITLNLKGYDIIHGRDFDTFTNNGELIITNDNKDSFFPILNVVNNNKMSISKVTVNDTAGDEISKFSFRDYGTSLTFDHVTVKVSPDSYVTSNLNIDGQDINNNAVVNINNSYMRNSITNKKSTINIDNSNIYIYRNINNTDGNINLTNNSTIYGLSRESTYNILFSYGKSSFTIDETSMVKDDRYNITVSGSGGTLYFNDDTIFINAGKLNVKCDFSEKANITNTGVINNGVLIDTGLETNLVNSNYISAISYSGNNIHISQTAGNINTITAKSSGYKAEGYSESDAQNTIDITGGNVTTFNKNYEDTPLYYGTITHLENCTVGTMYGDYVYVDNTATVNAYYNVINGNTNLHTVTYKVVIKDLTYDKEIAASILDLENCNLSAGVYANKQMNLKDCTITGFVNGHYSKAKTNINSNNTIINGNVSGILEMTGGTINGNVDGVINIHSGTINGNVLCNNWNTTSIVEDGTINGYIDAYNITVKGGTVDASNTDKEYAINATSIILGEIGGVPSVTTPSIVGNEYGIDSANFKFYDGIINAEQYLRGTLTDKEPGYSINIQNIVDSTRKNTTLRYISDHEKVVTYNNINFDSIQSAINSAEEGATMHMNLYVNYTLPEDLVIPAGLNVNLHLNGHILDMGTHQVTGEGTWNVIDDTYNGVGGAIYRFLANITGQEINPRDIIIYQMGTGEELNPATDYKLYKLIDNEYKVVKVKENEIGSYEIGNDTNILRTTNGQIYIDGIGEGTYKLVGSDSKELEFTISENGVSSNIRQNRYKTQSRQVIHAVATLILTLQTGVIRHPYIVVLTLIALITLGIIAYKKKKED